MFDDQVRKLFEDFGRSIGIPQLTADESGMCQLLVANRRMVQCIALPTQQQILFACSILNKSIDGHTALVMLRGNFMGSGCMGGALSVAPNGIPYLQMSIGFHGNGARRMLDTMERLVAQADVWEARLSSSAAAKSTSTSTLSRDMEVFGRAV